MLIYACYSAGILLIAFFALMFGRVVAPRAKVSVQPLESRPIKIALYLGATVPAVIMLWIGGARYYFAFWALAPALMVFLVIIQSSRKKGRHARKHEAISDDHVLQR